MEAVEHQSKPSAKVAWGPLAAVLVTIFGFLAAQVIGVLLVMVIAAVIGGEPVFEGVDEGQSYFDKPGYIFLTNILISSVLFGLVTLFIRARKASLRSLGLRWPELSDATKALAAYGVYFLAFIAISVVINAASPDLLDKNQDIGFDQNSNGPILGWIFVSLVILPPLIEEFLFRGFLYSGLRTKMTYVWAALFTSGLFGLAHLFGGEGGSLIWVSTIDTFILSLLLCHLREKTGGLAAPMMLHATKNLVAFSLLFIFKVG